MANHSQKHTSFLHAILLKIPQGVDLSKPHHVAKATQFKNAINGWQDLNNKDYFQWQGFLLCHGTEVEIVSDNWLDDVLQISMEPTLRSEVNSDLHGIPLHPRGSMTTLCCIIKRMVVKNQEARDGSETYIKTFDIKVFPGENVPTACLHLKAVVQALRDKCLPTNTICKVLKGFTISSTDSFNAFCATQIALRLGSFYPNLMQSTSMQQQLHDILNNLEATCLDLLGGKFWAGITASSHGSSFMAGTADGDEVTQAHTMVAMKDLSWDEWVNMYAKCHHCGEQSHIHPNCPMYLDKIKSGKIKRCRTCPSPCGPPKSCPPGCSAQQRDFMKDPKAKAFFLAGNVGNMLVT